LNTTWLRSRLFSGLPSEPLQAQGVVGPVALPLREAHLGVDGDVRALAVVVEHFGRRDVPAGTRRARDELDRPALGGAEEGAAVGARFEPEAVFVDQAVVGGAEVDEVVELGFAAVDPVLDVGSTSQGVMAR
jgi:hypothetical protein